MDEDSAWAQFVQEYNKNERLLWNLQQLTRELLVHLQQRLNTRRTLLFIEDTALLVARVARDLRKRVLPDHVQPTHLSDGRPIDFSELQ